MAIAFTGPVTAEEALAALRADGLLVERRPAVRRNAVPEAEALLTPAQVSALFRVDPKTVMRWARTGKLTSIRTLGGHRRYREAEVMMLLGRAGDPQPAVRAVPRIA